MCIRDRTAPVPGPITANIPVVQEDGLVNPYAKQEQAVAEARLAGQTGQGASDGVQTRTVVADRGPATRDTAAEFGERRAH